MSVEEVVFKNNSNLAVVNMPALTSAEALEVGGCASLTNSAMSAWYPSFDGGDIEVTSPFGDRAGYELAHDLGVIQPPTGRVGLSGPGRAYLAS